MDSYKKKYRKDIKSNFLNEKDYNKKRTEISLIFFFTKQVFKKK